MNSKKYLSILIFMIVALIAKAQSNLDQQAWVDSVFASMSTDQKIGQIFMVRAFSKPDPIEASRIVSIIDSFHVGGMCFFQGNPTRQAELTNLYQSVSKLPLFIGIDGEWGLGMRFPESVMKFPKQLTLGAISDDSLIYKMGCQIAQQCKRLGVHFNFAPVVDININAENPVINERSFGEDKFYVTSKAIAYMKGLQDNGIIATAKHFPGHGDTNADSHFELPVLNHTIDRLQEVELFPFKALINEGVASIMVGHLHIPQLDDRAHRSASLSYSIVTELLRHQLGYEGLIITDAMEMKGITKHFLYGQAEVEAFLAGCDIILMPDNLPAAFSMFKAYLAEGKILPSRLDESVKRILAAKYKANLHKTNTIYTGAIIPVLNSNENVALKSLLIESALTLATDEFNVLPFEAYHSSKMMTLSIGLPLNNTFHKRLEDYHTFTHFTIKKEIPILDRQKVITEAANYEYAIISLHDMSRSPEKGFGITKESIGLIKELATKTKVILVIFGSPYALKYFEQIPTIVVAYEDDDLFHDITAQSLFGVSAFNGRLPVTASTKFTLAGGLSKNKLGTLGYSVPERVGLQTKVLDKIDQLASELIANKAAPGCVVLVAKDNRIIYNKAFGNQKYDDKLPLLVDDVFDVASLTKILATTLGIMKLYDGGHIDVNDTLVKYIPQLKNTNKADITIADAMAHQARLVPFIPFYKETMSKQKNKTLPSTKYYRTSASKEFPIRISKKMFLKATYVDTIWKKIYESPLRDKEGYKYSDLGFYFMKKVIENASKTKLDQYIDKQIYQHLGLQNTTFNPTDKIPIARIVPTEKDNYWRSQLVHGTVHDMGAAMLGGVGGHAGLFSNANDIATIMQMLINNGGYGGHKFFEESTVDLFTTRYYKSTRRGLGFDLQDLDHAAGDNMSKLASPKTFGHTGFTGTCAYADPENKLIYIFLSNRTYPTMENNLLHKNDYRTKIQNIIYEAMHLH